jgi:hypothetical protein
MKSPKNLKSILNSIKNKMKMFLSNLMLLRLILDSKKLKKIWREMMYPARMKMYPARVKNQTETKK